MPQLSSPARPLNSNLHKRRVSASPEKFNTGSFAPLAIRTDLPIPRREPPEKRTRTANKLEVYYDSTGTPKIRETPDSIQSGFSPASAVFSPFPKSAALNFDTPSTSALPSGHHVVTSRLLNGKMHRLLPQVQKKIEFSLLQAFNDNDSLRLLLVSYLTIPSLLDLYAISKVFHHSFNQHATAFIMASMRTWSPNADQIFPWRCYQSLCIKDPVKKQKSKPVILGADIEKLRELSRDVPSLRWLQMVTWREGVTKDMTVQLATRALLTPPGTRNAIKRMWFVLDLPLNAHRLALIRNEEYISKRTISLATHFFIKVDMAFTRPGTTLFPWNHSNQAHYPNRWAHGAAVGCTLREKLTAERSFTPLWRVLRGWSWNDYNGERPLTQADTIQLWARSKVRIPATAPDNLSRQLAFGLEIGPTPLTGYERVYRPNDDKTLTEDQRKRAIAKLPQNRYHPKILLRPDELLMGEAVRRQMKQHKRWTTMMLWGFVAPSGKNIRVSTEEELLKIFRSSDTERLRRKARAVFFEFGKDGEKGSKDRELLTDGKTERSRKDDGSGQTDETQETPGTGAFNPGLGMN